MIKLKNENDMGPAGKQETHVARNETAKKATSPHPSAAIHRSADEQPI